MTLAQDVSETFADAHAVHAASLERLDSGDIRDAAEKAWCAIVRATDALVLARTGVAPERSPHTTRGLHALVREDGRVGRLLDRYNVAQSALHGNCFYHGVCEPVDRMEQLIRGVAGYIQDTQELAGFQPAGPSA